MVDARHRRAERHREPLCKSLEEPAITLAQPPVDPAVLVADVVLDRDAVELGAVPPSTGRVEQFVPAPAGRHQARQRPVERFRCGSPARPGLGFARREPIGFGLDRFAAAAQPGRPFRRPLVDPEAEFPGDRRQWVAVGRMQPFGAAVERKAGRLDRVHAPAHPVARFEHENRDRAFIDQPPCRADAGSAGADHRDIDLRSQTPP